MGELRAYAVPAWAVRALLSRPENRSPVLDLVRAALGDAQPPAALGPIYARVPGAPAVRDDEPSREDVERLLVGAPVPPTRARATWRVVEAVASGMAAAAVRAVADRPRGLAPLGLAVPDVDGLLAGSWTPDEAARQPGVEHWLAALSGAAAGSAEHDVVVFWEQDASGGR